MSEKNQPVAQEANVKVGGSTVYVTNNHRRESNRWWATVYPGFDDDDKRVSIEECDAIAKRIADALNAAPHHPVSAEAGKGVDERATFEQWCSTEEAELDTSKIRNEKLDIEAYRSRETFAAWKGWYARSRFASPSESVAVGGEVSERMQAWIEEAVSAASAVDKWQALYRRMREVAAGYSNLAEETGSSRRLDREFEAIEQEARNA